MKTSTRFFAILNLLGFAGVLTMNALANILPIGGMNTGQVSDLYPNLFVPAGITFSIWGIIYLQLAVFVVLGIVRAFGKGNDTFLAQIGFLFLLSCLLNMAWIFAWQYLKVGISLIIMLGFWEILWLINERLERVSGDTSVWLGVKAAFRVYWGWISLATIANITASLVHIGWSGWGISEVSWTLIMVAIAVILPIVFVWRKRDGFFALPIAWALLGIYWKRIASEPYYPEIALMAIIGAVIVFLVGIVGIYRGRKDA